MFFLRRIYIVFLAFFPCYQYAMRDAACGTVEQNRSDQCCRNFQRDAQHREFQCQPDGTERFVFREDTQICWSNAAADGCIVSGSQIC